MYIFNLINEIKIWLKVRSVAKEFETTLNESGFRVDWVGRIYTVINLPEEVINQPFSREGYVLMKLREYDRLFLNMGISDVIAPELVELKDADAYLLILSPDRDYLKPRLLLWSLFKIFMLFFIIRILYNFILKNFESITYFFNKVLSLIS